MAHCPSHEHKQAITTGMFQPSAASALRIGSRRWMLQTGLSGLAAVSASAMMSPRARAEAIAATAAQTSKKSVILFWLSGGPSQIDMWDPKPDAPAHIRGPFQTIETKVPGILFSHHLPKQAAIADKISVVRAVDCSSSNHTPITMQAGNPNARRMDNGRNGDGHPSMGSVAAKFRGPNHPDMPAFVGLARDWVSDMYGAGDIGATAEPVKGLELLGKFNLPDGIAAERLQDRNQLRSEFDRVRAQLDQRETMLQVDQYQLQAYEMVLSGYVRKAFDISAETDATRDAYGRNSVGEKALLARRLVESGTTYTVVSGAWGYFDNHGDDVPPWGGIEKGLGPALPNIDQAYSALVTDLEQRGLLDSTLVLMMGEFGRSPVMTKGAGRDHWTAIMSLIMSGGGYRHGQAIGSTDRRGGEALTGVVRPQDLAATIFRHLEIDLASHWINPQGRPMPIVVDGGRPIPELG